ncbi:hypothetical protein AN169_02310 [Staphylococcus aureus]|nr:hypothetical protein AN169_02310 [Staphylococcus aureus]
MMIESGTSQCPRLYNVILAGPNIENFVKKFYRQWKLGTGPNIEADGKSDFNNVEVGGPNTEKLEPQFLQAMEVGDGPNTEADGKTDFNNVQVGDGAQHREFRKEILQAMEVGDNKFNFVKISFLSHSLCMSLIMYSYF